MSLENKSKSNPKFHRLLQHHFVLDVLMNYREHSQSISSQAMQAYQAGKNPEILFTKKMAYHHNVNHYMSRFIGTIERIEQSLIFIRRFPNSKFFVENNIGFYKWVNYHYSNYLVMSVSLYDLSLLLTNEVFVLGIEPWLCNEKRVANHKLVKGTGVKNSLDKINKAIEEYRDVRNLYAHRGEIPKLGFMDRLESYELIQKAEKDFGIEMPIDYLQNPLTSPYFRRDLFRRERKELLLQMGQKIDIFIDLVLELFSSEKHVYDLVTQQLNNQSDDV